MSVEIREISISMTLLDEQDHGARSAASPEDGSSDARRTCPDMQIVVDRCVEEVLQILKDRNEA
ncbi:MAG: DUF5908 family protein [Desulfovibrio sp.]|uniref:DUF5908 family protein n=1 Tax=Desulfovibrio sp. TaxID=885 RepID=UPI0039E2683E